LRDEIGNDLVPDIVAFQNSYFEHRSRFHDLQPRPIIAANRFWSWTA